MIIYLMCFAAAAPVVLMSFILVLFAIFGLDVSTQEKGCLLSLLLVLDFIGFIIALLIFSIAWLENTDK